MKGGPRLCFPYPQRLIDPWIAIGDQSKFEFWYFKLQDPFNAFQSPFLAWKKREAEKSNNIDIIENINRNIQKY